MAGEIVVFTSDHHTNSTIGLCPPIINLDDGGEYRQSLAQEWLWSRWLSFWQEVEGTRRALGLPVISIVVGDLSDGDHHGTPQIISRNPDTILDIAIDTLKPALAVASKTIVLRGTEAHTGKSSWVEERVAKEIGAEQCPLGTSSWWHLLARFGGVLFDVAHHPESGDVRPWTKSGGAIRVSATVLNEYATTRDPYPDVVIRAHRHGFRDSGTSLPVRTFFTPPWQLTTAFGHRIGVSGKVQEVGGLVFICEGGKYSVSDRLYRPRRSEPYVTGF